MTPRIWTLAGLIAAVVMGVDQAAKQAWLRLWPGADIEVTSFFNLVLAWNRGVSFSMLTSQTDWAPYALSAVALIVVGGLLWWLRSISRDFLAVAIGLIVGGALGNVIDRLLYGAVVDFLDFHVAGWHWPAFNVADAAIVIGVTLILFDGMFGAGANAKAKDETTRS